MSNFSETHVDETDPELHQPPSKGSGVWKYLLIGCLGIVMLSICGCGIGMWYIAANGRSLLFKAVRTPIAQSIESSEMTDDDKKVVLQQVDRVGEAWSSGKISDQQLTNIMEKLAESPLIPVAMTEGMKAKYIKKSGLADDEKAEASKTVSRIARGMYEETLEPKDVQVAVDPMMEIGPNGKKKLKDQVTDTELREVIASLKIIADEAEVPDEEFKVEIGAEFKRAVDESLKDSTE